MLDIDEEDINNIGETHKQGHFTRKDQVLDAIQNILGVDARGIAMTGRPSVGKPPTKKRKATSVGGAVSVGPVRSVQDLIEGEQVYKFKPEGPIVKIVRSLIEPLPSVGSYVVAMDNLLWWS